MNKSTIVITDDGKQVKLEVTHEPVPTGPAITWHMPATAAQAMIKFLMGKTKAAGLDPFYQQTRNSITGETDITTRPKEDKKHGPEPRLD